MHDVNRFEVNAHAYKSRYTKLSNKTVRPVNSFSKFDKHSCNLNGKGI